MPPPVNLPLSINTNNPMGPPATIVRSPPAINKISGANQVQQTIGGGYVKPRTLSEVAMDIMEKRKDSFDALNISEMIFDDLVGVSGHHSSGTDTDLGLLDDLLFDPAHPHQPRRSMRFDSFAEAFANHSESFGSDFGTGAENVDLSAYATLAQSLQNNKTKQGNNRDSSKLVSQRSYALLFLRLSTVSFSRI